MADNLIEILIKFGLDKSKAEEASRELRRLGETSAAAGKAGVKAATEHAEATEKSTKKIEGMNKAMNLLESKLGEFGQLAKFVMSPETLGVAALAVGLDQIFGHFQKIKEEAEAAGMKLQAMDQAKLEGLQKALQTSRESAAGLTRELAGAGHVMDTLKEGFDRQSAARTAAGLPTDPAAELQARATAQPGLNAAAEAATAAVAVKTNATYWGIIDTTHGAAGPGTNYWTGTAIIPGLASQLGFQMRTNYFTGGLAP